MIPKNLDGALDSAIRTMRVMKESRLYMEHDGFVVFIELTRPDAVRVECARRESSAGAALIARAKLPDEIPACDGHEMLPVGNGPSAFACSFLNGGDFAKTRCAACPVWARWFFKGSPKQPIQVIAPGDDAGKYAEGAD